MIPFNKPFYASKSLDYIKDALVKNKVSEGEYTEKCKNFIQDRFAFKNVFFTSSCTSALEMAALLIGLKQGDEVIVPSYAYVSVANSCLLREAKVVFADSQLNNPNIDIDSLESLITPNTKAIIPIHYAGFACEIEKLKILAKEHNLCIIEDAAHAFGSYYNGNPLGSFGDLSAFSFHETKNITSGQGGMLVVNNESWLEKAEIIINRGTDRKDFLKGMVSKYSWCGLGSSFVMSELTAALLFAQFEIEDEIKKKRLELWGTYYNELAGLMNSGYFSLPEIDKLSQGNAHIFYLICQSEEDRKGLINFLNNRNITSAFHYNSLHKSPYFLRNNKLIDLPNSEKHSNRLLRLPLYFEMNKTELDLVINSVKAFYKG